MGKEKIMTDRLQVFKCEECGNIVEVLFGGGAPLICCGAEMILQEEKTSDATTEKHVPYIEKVEGGYKVKIGQNAAHPMEEAHYIQWIELIVGGNVNRQYLKPGDAPEACFCVCCEGCCCETEVSAREYCNVHGHWKG